MSENVAEATDFTYPTKEEREHVEKIFPVLKEFGFSYPKSIELLLNETKDPYEVKRLENLYWWDNILINKFGKLKNSYLHAVVNFNRGLGGHKMLHVKEVRVAKFQFDFYSESFYYYFFATRDVIFQVINLYIGGTLKEKDVDIRRLKEVIDPPLSDTLEKFLTNTEDASKIRNHFAHKFPVNTRDNRPSIEKKKDKIIYMSGTGAFTSSEKIMNNMNRSTESLVGFVEELRDIMIEKV